MKERIKSTLQSIIPQLIKNRRDFHQYPETAWTEFRTSSLVASRLAELGFDVVVGKELFDEEQRMGMPGKEELENHYKRAISQGGDSEYLKTVEGGFTGVLGILRNGPGPVIALRFDMDALSISESTNEMHFPYALNFSSKNMGNMHACGHDGHSAIGLGVAELIMALKDHFKGTLKLIFQPAEEGVRGAKSMMKAGIVDDVDYFIGHHLFPGWRIGELVCGMNNFAATTKLDATFIGKPAHAGSNPQGGKNALLAAATAVLNLHGIERHSEGGSRINVGKMEAGLGRNVICPQAKMEIEVRGEDVTICDYMFERTNCILKAAADMHDCKLETKIAGAAENVRCDEEFTSHVKNIAKELNYECFPPEKSAGSEDISWFMNRVSAKGGKATLIGIGADRMGIGITDKVNRDKVLVPHTSSFDFDEAVLPKAVELLAHIVFSVESKA